MSAPRNIAPVAAVPAGDLARCLVNIHASHGFSRAPRMRRLLAYLVEQTLAGSSGNTSEYAIGMDVFDRDPRQYSTGTDPIVRVQMRRLRDKLRRYYAEEAGDDPVELSVPVGGYTLAIAARRAQPAAVPEQITWQRLLCLSPDGQVRDFASGLNEELSDCLYHTLGKRIDTMQAPPGAATALRRLEGTLRADGAGIRIALRLADRQRSCVLWSRQFDFAPTLSIAAQIEVAHRLAYSVQEYLHGESKL